jgi:hypothetical protein
LQKDSEKAQKLKSSKAQKLKSSRPFFLKKKNKNPKSLKESLQ